MVRKMVRLEGFGLTVRNRLVHWFNPRTFFLSSFLWSLKFINKLISMCLALNFWELLCTPWLSNSNAPSFWEESYHQDNPAPPGVKTLTTIALKIC